MSRRRRRVIPFPPRPPRNRGIIEFSTSADFTPPPVEFSTVTDYLPADSPLDGRGGLSTLVDALHGPSSGGGVSQEKRLDLSSPPPKKRNKFSTKPKHVLDALARELAGLGVRRAYLYVRQHDFTTVTLGLTELLTAEERGERFTNPAGLLVWLVRQAEAVADEEQE